MSYNVNINNEVGAYGTFLVKDTAAKTPVTPTGYSQPRKWFRFVPLTTSVIAAATSAMGGDSVAGITVTVGTWLDIPDCTSFQLTSGSGVLYYTL